MVQLAGPAGNGNALQNQVRVKVHQQAVFECSGLCFVAVDGQVPRLSILGRQEGPLHPGGEAGTTTTSQDRIFHFIDDGRWFHAQAIFERGVSATISIGLARGDGAVFCFAPCVLERAAAGNVLGQDRFVKKHGGDFQRWLRLGGSSISSMVVRRRMVPSRLVVSVCRLTSRRLEVGRVAADQIMPRKAPTPCMRVGLVRLVLIPVRPPNEQLARGSKVQSIHRFATCKGPFHRHPDIQVPKESLCRQRWFRVRRCPTCL